MTHETPALTVDVIIRDGDRILLIKPGNAYFSHTWALPGGHVEIGETVEHAALREMKEETSLDVKLLEILGIYSDPARDPRGHKASVAFVADVDGGSLKAADDVLDAKWVKRDEVPKGLAYDHDRIFSDYLKWLAKPGTYWSSKT